MDIIIRTRRERVRHKFEKELLKEYGGNLDDVYCYWTGIHPKNVKKGDKVFFSDGKRIFAEGKILGTNREEGLLFRPLKEVDHPQPKNVPTRGFIYVKKVD